VASASARLRQSNRTDKRIELTIQLLLNDTLLKTLRPYTLLKTLRWSPMLNDTFVRRISDLEKTVDINFLLISLSVTTVADAFLHKGNVWAHGQLPALWRNTRKKQISQESNPCIRPKFPKSPNLQNRGSQPFSDHVPLAGFLIEFLEFRNYKGRPRFYVSKLIYCKCTINVPLQIGKHTP